MQAPLWVKIGMGIGFSIIGLFAIDTIGNMAFHDGEEASHGGEEIAAAHTADEPASNFDLAAALATAEPNENAVKKCSACHTFEEGGDNGIGPDLWNVVDRPKASAEGFNYSSALQGLGGTWTYEDLFHFLSNPKKFAPGTKMTFAGFKKEKDAVAAIAYLRTLSNSPVALPKVTASEDAAAPEEGTADENVAPTEEAAPEEAAPAADEEAAPATDDAAAPAAEEVAPASGDQAAAAEASSGDRFASADVSKGERVFKKCQVCHSGEKDGPNKIGPDLWNVMTRGKGAVEDFNYSPALKSAGGQWTVEDLDHFLTNPKGFLPGTKMTFAGLKRESDRTNLIAYLATLDDNPVELK